ncbi:MAG: glycosyltransferase family 2 protein [Chitinophagaceae bacterium]|nr:MAG: glycosyltransferase family 2 protein [Chitinophagaceae bacterium]
MQNLSVVIITYNEEEHIGDCISSVTAVADEIIVLDCFSTDKTVEIARSKGATVHKEKWRGYIEQKNRALEFANYDYVLSLDADEMLDQRLLDSIITAKKNFSHKAYQMNRRTNYCGRFIRHGQWYPDKKLRLFDKRNAAWGGLNPHDKIVLSAALPVAHLPGDILHYSYNSIEEHVAHGNKFSSIAAETLFALGKKAYWFNIIFNPVWTFLQGYFIRMGFLDGVAGFIIAKISAQHTFLKYIKLYQLRRLADKPQE